MGSEAARAVRAAMEVRAAARAAEICSAGRSLGNQCRMRSQRSLSLAHHPGRCRWGRTGCKCSSRTWAAVAAHPEAAVAMAVAVRAAP